MKNALCTLTLALLVSTVPFAHAAPLEDQHVESAEFQFDAAFSSPPRTHDSGVKKTPQAANTVDTLDWQEKNATLTALPQVITSKERTASPATTDFWIFDSWITLTNDIDYDGYHSSLTVEFDADTIYNRAYVYAILYLSRSDVYESYHVTSVFAIDGDSSNDSFVVESALLQGYPSDEYDILIELYDVDTDELLAFTDAYDDADLAYAPLESENYEYIEETTVVIVDEHGGSMSGFLLVVLLISGYRTRVAYMTHKKP